MREVVDPPAQTSVYAGDYHERGCPISRLLLARCGNRRLPARKCRLRLRISGPRAVDSHIRPKPGQIWGTLVRGKETDYGAAGSACLRVVLRRGCFAEAAGASPACSETASGIPPILSRPSATRIKKSWALKRLLSGTCGRT